MKSGINEASRVALFHRHLSSLFPEYDEEIIHFVLGTPKSVKIVSATSKIAVIDIERENRLSKLFHCIVRV